jgi:hypothetical protein
MAPESVPTPNPIIARRTSGRAAIVVSYRHGLSGCQTIRLRAAGGLTSFHFDGDLLAAIA